VGATSEAKLYWKGRLWIGRPARGAPWLGVLPPGEPFLRETGRWYASVPADATSLDDYLAMLVDFAKWSEQEVRTALPSWAAGRQGTNSR
jgi:hypothetical protein